MTTNAPESRWQIVQLPESSKHTEEIMVEFTATEEAAIDIASCFTGDDERLACRVYAARKVEVPVV
ncbi:hypothetical protein [Leucobacter sp. cx-169]|uniref:hypothetical protein n=1 Tax=Leucobacter sp. cx-169 TaxID=2770549 RepID=UPI00165E3891|nr:hypothetical protein [Leucobacter sp. cx-169]MBC9927190.1 hypothetical protein [Leucobacter sp. cx-169]